MLEIFQHFAGFERVPPEYNNRSQRCNYVMKPECACVCVRVCEREHGGAGREHVTDFTYPFKAAFK